MNGGFLVTRKRMLLRRLRLARGLTQKALAERAGCSAVSVARIEGGLEPPYPKRGAKIAAALGWCGDYETLYSNELTDQEVEEALRACISGAA